MSNLENRPGIRRVEEEESGEQENETSAHPNVVYTVYYIIAFVGALFIFFNFFQEPVKRIMGW